MSLDTPFTKAISVTAFLGLSLTPIDSAAPASVLSSVTQVADIAAESPLAESPLGESLLAASPLAASPLALPPPSLPPLPPPSLPPPLSVATAQVQAPASAPSAACALGMVLIDGDYCPDADQVCLKWLDPPPYQNLRCGEYAKPVTCRGARQHRRFCIDREEYVENSAGVIDPLPTVNRSWGEAKTLCEARGARLCKESEWEFACEGPEMNPYPYGFKREPGTCNHDRTDLGGAEDKLIDHRAPASAFPQCTSAFGVHDMTGNVDEWVEREGMAAPRRSALRGGWWLPGRNRCRAATTHHEETYSAKQVGFRCCAETL